MYFYTYLLRCSDGSFYCGYTNDLEKRVKTHNSGKGAKCTRSRLPAELVYWETFDSKSNAMRREYEIKQMTHAHKQQLVDKYKNNL